MSWPSAQSCSRSFFADRAYRLLALFFLVIATTLLPELSGCLGGVLNQGAAASLPDKPQAVAGPSAN